LLRSAGEYKSPITEKQRGANAPWPKDMIILAVMNETKLKLRAARIAPTMYKPRAKRSMMRRPYMSESLPNVRVTKAEAKAGRDMAQE